MKTLAELAKLYSLPPSQGGGDKGDPHTYIPIYEETMTKRDNIALLEVGVFQGHSIKMWKEYFQDSIIHGIDVDMSRLVEPIEGVKHCNANSREEVDRVLGDQTYDYIVDDASHQTDQIIATWNNINHRLRPDGIYYIEDLQPNQVETITQAVQPANVRIHEDWDIMLVITKTGEQS